MCLTSIYLQKKDPIAVWTAFQSQPEIAELANFAQLILTVVANQAGCEQTFSDLKIKQAQHRNLASLYYVICEWILPLWWTFSDHHWLASLSDSG